jgi:hypothetical protein
MAATAGERPLSERCISAGEWIIEGYRVRRVAPSSSVKRWLIDDPAGKRVGQRSRLGDAREFIRGLLRELSVGFHDGLGSDLWLGRVLRVRVRLRVLSLG